VRAATDPRLRRASRWAVLLVVASVVFVFPHVAPASASAIVEANSVALDISATCERGNVIINYTTGGSIGRQTANLTSENGTVLDTFESAVYGPEFDGSEYILTKAGSQRGGVKPVPPAGAILGVYVTLGTAPPTPINAEFFVLYRCDTQRNDRGGHNTVLKTCIGDYGTCPQSAQEALAEATTTTTQPSSSSTTQPADTPTTEPVADVRAATAPAAVAVVPRFTG